MSEINLKGNGKKIGITNTEILNVILGKLFVYLKIRMKILFVTPLETMWFHGFSNFFSVV